MSIRHTSPEILFHRWKDQLLVADKLISVLVLGMLSMFRFDYVVIGAYVLIIPYLLLTERKTFLSHLFVSSSVALVWMFVAKNEYAYNREFASLLGINLFPLFAWALGLFGVYVIYSHYSHLFQRKNAVVQVLSFSLLYIIILISVETIAYHVFNIHNLAAAGYAGLPFCDCIHAPQWMQISYLLMGPVFFLICELLSLENPHVATR